ALRLRDIEPLHSEDEMASVPTPNVRNLFVTWQKEGDGMKMVPSRVRGVHLPERMIEKAQTIKSSFPNMLVGASVHSVDRAERAAEHGADFLTFGPVFETPSKRALGFGPQGLDMLKAVVNAVNVPVLAIGGITPAGARACLEHGAWGVAVVRDLVLAPDLAERLAEYKAILGTL